jgi:uncharacterized protein
MSLTNTALYAGILALIAIALAINVTVHRVKLRVPIGDGGNAEMRRMIRLHGNAAEYIPLAIVLMLIYEITMAGTRRCTSSASRWWRAACCKRGACREPT